MEIPLGDVIEMLNGRPTDEVPEARDALIERGPSVVPALVDRLSDLNNFGKLAAIEVLQDLGGWQACAGLESLVTESHPVRMWASIALGELGCTEAVPALQRLNQRLRSEQGKPAFGWVRTALSQLGARDAVVPELTASLAHDRVMVGGTELSPYWSSARLADVLNDLAAHRQAVVYLRLWPLTEDGEVVWTVMRLIFEEVFDWSAPWQENLDQAHAAALRYAAAAPVADPSGREFVVEIEWIDESDVLL